MLFNTHRIAHYFAMPAEIRAVIYHPLYLLSENEAFKNVLIILKRAHLRRQIYFSPAHRALFDVFLANISCMLAAEHTFHIRRYLMNLLFQPQFIEGKHDKPACYLYASDANGR